jgi:hypothetical protein
MLSKYFWYNLDSLPLVPMTTGIIFTSTLLHLCISAYYQLSRGHFCQMACMSSSKHVPFISEIMMSGFLHDMILSVTLYCFQSIVIWPSWYVSPGFGIYLHHLFLFTFTLLYIHWNIKMYADPIRMFYIPSIH